MREFLFSLFEVSLTMGAAAALLLALSPVWKRRFRPQWRYWAWLLVALRLAVPVNLSLPQAPVTLPAPAPVELSAAWADGAGGLRGVEFAARPAEDVPAGEQGGTAQADTAAAEPSPGLSLTGAQLSLLVWAAGAAASRPSSRSSRAARRGCWRSSCPGTPPFGGAPAGGALRRVRAGGFRWIPAPSCPPRCWWGWSGPASCCRRV